jgi:hypothetical protein
LWNVIATAVGVVFAAPLVAITAAGSIQLGI